MGTLISNKLRQAQRDIVFIREKHPKLCELFLGIEMHAFEAL